MEETLTDCLVRVREDLSQLEIVRDYLDTKADTDECCSVTWRTIEAFNSILSVCSSQNSPETNALDTLLDSFCYLARNNADDSVWDDFGFELGIICVKVLTAIERCDVFEILFCKLLSVISIISEHNSNVWKAAARQILNVLINKKVSFSYLEPILKLYICILKNINDSVLRDFSSQNLHLLRTLSLLVQKVGDFEIQSSVIELIFLHLSKETKLMSDFFSVTDTNLFQSLQFADFEHDCRLYLNGVNKRRRGVERRVYSIPCHCLYLGGCFVEPPPGGNSVWVDANKDTERVSIKCGDENGSRAILVRFSDILSVRLDNVRTEGNLCLTIQTKSLIRLYKDARNDDICLVADNGRGVFEFVNFLQGVISGKEKKKRGGRGSRAMDCLVIDRMKVQDDFITSSVQPGIDRILPDVFTLFEDKVTGKVVPESQELSSNFVESLNKHIESQELRHAYEDSIETIEFLQTQTPRSHKLFRSPQKTFQITEEKPESFFSIFGGKENHPPLKPENRKTYTRKARNVNCSPRVLRERKNLELSNTQSQDYFRGNIFLKRKPCLPKLKRNAKPTKNGKQVTDATDIVNRKTPAENKKNQNGNKSKQEKENSKVISKVKPNSILNVQQSPKARENDANPEVELKERRSKYNNGVQEPPSREKKQTRPELKKQTKKVSNIGEKNKVTEVQEDSKPSLLDPNGYAYQRWCKPTTSERSNFWLKKLNVTTKSKGDPDNVFDFSEDSESLTRREKKVVRSRRRSKRTSLREVKEMLKKSPPVKKKESPRQQPDGSRPSPPCTPEFIEDQADSVNEGAAAGDSESVSDEDKLQAKKRGRSDEDSSTVRRHLKRKPKLTLPRHVIISLRRRLQKAEEKDKQQTDEIIRTVEKAANHLFNHIQRKDGERVVSYLNAAEAASNVFGGEVGELDIRVKRIQRAILYYEAGCSVSEFCESLEGQLSKLREVLKDFMEKKDTSQTIHRINARLTDLIKSEIERSIANEWALKRSKLLKCATILGVDFRQFR